MIHTASPDEFLKNQGVESYFNAVLNNLSHQTFKDFEFIFVDTFYDHNKDRFNSLSSTFPFVVKHVPIHHEHRYWFDQGYVYISAAKNTGLLYADGELVITCDDAEFFPEHLLQLYWDHYKSGYYLHALHKRMKSIKTENGLPVFPIEGDVYINDHRLNNAPDKVKHHRQGNLLFAGSSFSLGDALHLNGFNERMDGCKSLEDCDFGNRLTMIGRSFASEKNGFFYILDHQSYGDDIKTTIADGQLNDPPHIPLPKKQISNFIAIENFGMLRASEELIEPQVNKFPITNRHLKIIQRETLKYRNFDILAPAHKPMLDIWMNTPIFNLKKQREDLRNSSEWKWPK